MTHPFRQELVKAFVRSSKEMSWCQSGLWAHEPDSVWHNSTPILALVSLKLLQFSLSKHSQQTCFWGCLLPPRCRLWLLIIWEGTFLNMWHVCVTLYHNCVPLDIDRCTLPKWKRLFCFFLAKDEMLPHFPKSWTPWLLRSLKCSNISVDNKKVYCQNLESNSFATLISLYFKCFQNNLDSSFYYPFFFLKGLLCQWV